LPSKKKPEVKSTRFDLFERNFMRDLILLAEVFNENLLQKNAARGHTGMRMAFAPVLLHIAKSGTRAIDIAAQTDLSKQAIGKTVRSLEELGYIRQEVSSEDARNKYLKFTAKGVQMIGDTQIGIGEITRDIEALIGKQKTRDLIDTVALLV
jgi:DNA-binding MarR family transcriptional regulator